MNDRSKWTSGKRATPTLARTGTVALLVMGVACNDILGLEAGEPWPAEAGAPTGVGGGGGGSSCEPGQAEDCYSGVPASTEDVGVCRGGTRTCSADGKGYGSCAGEVTPQPTDDCNVVGDEDCDGSGCSDLLWGKIFGDSSNQYPGAVGTDGSGNVYVAGTFQGTIQFGQTALISAGANDIYLAKLSPEGDPIWSKRFGDASSQAVNGIAVTGDGVLALTGDFDGTLSFGGATLVSAGGSDVFVAKLDPTGTEIWSRRFGAASSQRGTDVAIDSAENVVIVGNYYGIVDFGNGNLPPPLVVGDQSVFLAKLASSTGNAIWSRGIGGGFHDAAAVAVDGSDSVLVAGSYAGAIDFGTGALSSAGGSDDMFLAKLDAQGITSWAQGFGGTFGDQLNGIAIDPSGNVLLAGVFSATVSFGGATMTSAGLQDVCVAKLTTAGNHVWSRRFGDAEQQRPSSVALNPDGGIVLAGSFEGSMDFGGGTLIASGAKDVFLATLDGQGNHLWSKRFGDLLEQDAGSVAVDGSGNALLTGSTEGSVDFGNGPVRPAGGLDALLAKFAR